jgi:hypothetical protein
MKRHDNNSRLTLRQGLFLLAVMTAVLAFFGVVPAEQIAIEALGKETQGHVTEHRVTSFGLRYATKAVYRFTLDDGREIEGQSSFETSPLPSVGSTVQVRYLPFWPAVSSYDRANLRYWGFWAISTLFLALACIWVVLLGKVVKRAAPSFR